MTEFLTIVGWLLFGGAGGYATERWKFVYVIVLALLGLSMIVTPTMPGLVGEGNGTWGESIAFVGGIIIGVRIAKREVTDGN